MTTMPEAPNPARVPWDIIETDPRAADFALFALLPEADEVEALWRMPEGVDPSVKDAPHCDWSAEAEPEVREGIAELMIL